MSEASDREFVEYAESRVQRLRQRAYLLCRDWHLAQDLTQVTLAKLYASWRRASKADSIDAYATKIMLRVFLDHKRLRSSQEVVIADAAAESVQHDFTPELRITLLEALGRLSPRMLGVSQGVVKTQSMRALAQLRGLLGEDIGLLTA
jgi:DNA-directed RNA polymerase specialized sigma24 family protein